MLKNTRAIILCAIRYFKDIESGRIRASTSTLSLLEILVQPYRLKNESLVLKFYSLLTTYPNLIWIDLTLNIADLAARLRAEYNLKTPDSIQAASAIASGASGFICNDNIFKKNQKTQKQKTLDKKIEIH
ncbi:MAG: PIN domain-containing protein [Deltaproteobacteria bacterium]|nr:PIN domain-containing protein [Deltaproteobacteria bacterium]